MFTPRSHFLLPSSPIRSCVTIDTTASIGLSGRSTRKNKSRPTRERSPSGKRVPTQDIANPSLLIASQCPREDLEYDTFPAWALPSMREMAVGRWAEYLGTRRRFGSGDVLRVAARGNFLKGSKLLNSNPQLLQRAFCSPTTRKSIDRSSYARWIRWPLHLGQRTALLVSGFAGFASLRGLLMNARSGKGLYKHERI